MLKITMKLTSSAVFLKTQCLSKLPNLMLIRLQLDQALQRWQNRTKTRCSIAFQVIFRTNSKALFRSFKPVLEIFNLVRIA
jgi:hypothetical protein